MPVVQQKSTLVPVSLKSTNYTVVEGDAGTELNFEITANRTVTLPEISSVGDGFNVMIRNSATGAFSVTVAVSGSDTVEGGSIITLNPEESIWLRGDDGDWLPMNTYLPDGAVTTDKIADNAVNGTKIAMGSDAQGDILYYDGTNYVRLPAGTSGQVLETQGSGANPRWIDAPSSGGGWTFVSSATASSSSSIEFTGFQAGYDYLVEFYGIQASTISFIKANLGVSGPTYRTSNYQNSTTGINDSNALNSDTQTTYITMGSASVGTSGDQKSAGNLYIIDPAAVAETWFRSHGTQRHSTTTTLGNWMAGGVHTVSEAIDAVKFAMVSGNISSGEFKLYRRANS